jgi:hypothetical protein
VPPPRRTHTHLDHGTWLRTVTGFGRDSADMQAARAIVCVALGDRGKAGLPTLLIQQIFLKYLLCAWCRAKGWVPRGEGDGVSGRQAFVRPLKIEVRRNLFYHKTGWVGQWWEPLRGPKGIRDMRIGSSPNSTALICLNPFPLSEPQFL